MATIKGGLFTKGGSAGGGGANGLYVMFDGTNIVDNSDGTFGFKKSDISSTMNIQSPVAIEWTFELQKGDVIAYLEDLYAVIDLENASDDTFVRVVQLSSFGLTQNPIVSVHTTGNNVDYFYIKTKGDGGTQYMVNCGGGGSQLYQHNITIIYTQSGQYQFHICCQFNSDSNTPITTKAALATLVYNKGFTTSAKLLPATGQFAKKVGSNDYKYITGGLWSDNGSNLYIQGTKVETTGSTVNDGNVSLTAFTSMEDVVI